MRMNVRQCLSRASISLLLAGCGGSLPSPVLVDKLRLLAITADPAEMLADGTVTVHAVWADGSPHAGRPVFFLWRLCPETAGADPRTCLLRDHGNDLGPAQNGNDTVTLRASDLPASPTLGTPPAQSYILLLAMCPDQAPVFDTSLGQYECPSEQSTPFEQREGIQGYHHVIVRAAVPPALNTVPAIARVNIGGIDPAMNPAISAPRCARNADGTPMCGGVPLVLFPAPGAAESYALSDGGVANEALLASFFVTAGSTDRPRGVPSDTDPNGQDGALRVTWYPPATAGPVKVWFALHDGRGGDSAAGPFVVSVQ